MRIICFRCYKKEETTYTYTWVLLEKDEENDAYRGTCSSCGAEMVLKSIESVERAVAQGG